MAKKKFTRQRRVSGPSPAAPASRQQAKPPVLQPVQTRPAPTRPVATRPAPAGTAPPGGSTIPGSVAQPTISQMIQNAATRAQQNPPPRGTQRLAQAIDEATRLAKSLETRATPPPPAPPAPAGGVRQLAPTRFQTARKGKRRSAKIARRKKGL